SRPNPSEHLRFTSFGRRIDMTAVEYHRSPNRVQLGPIPGAFERGGDAPTAARPSAPSGDPVFWAIRFLPRPRRSAMYTSYWYCREVEAIARDETSVLLKKASWRTGAAKSGCSTTVARAAEQRRPK